MRPSYRRKISLSELSDVVTATSVSISIVDEAVISDVIDDTEIHSVSEILKDSLNIVV
jgi:hypothetical protein